ncbi:hypothetical protein [Cellulomonas sp. URHD0024]|uniref:effector-associated constant component EACC1 n=1 Tax=Cellulomonas sp. URHD0024 TaxID=1302620 RepID=UPI0003FC8085|nr:hypothetical protein [Cellulomonas sp. URHD0024]
MDVTITVQGDGATDQLRALDQELSDVDELRGRVRPVAGRPRPGELGVLDSALVVAVGQGGAITVMVAALVAWLRRRVGTLSVTLTVGENSLEVTSENVRGLTAEQVRSLVTELRESLTESAGG